MVHPIFEKIIDRVFVQDSVLHKIIQKLKEPEETEKEKENDTNSEDKKIL